MRIQPMAGPGLQAPPQATTRSPGAESARAAAIAKLTSGSSSSAPAASASPQQSQEHPVVNPSAISPEEALAVRPPSDDSTPNESPDTAPKEESKPDASDPSLLSDKYAQLAKREKALRAKALAQEQAIKAREASIAEREARLSQTPNTPSIDESKYVPRELLAKNPLEALVSAGLTSDQITELLLNAPKADEISRDNTIVELRAELKAIKDAQEKQWEQARKDADDQRHQSYQQALTQIKNEAQQLVSVDPEFETIKETGSVDDVVDLIKRTFDKDGILMTVEEAAKEVESYLVEEALKVTRINKIKQRLAQNAAAAPKAAEAAKPASQQPAGAKTLTNNMSGTRQLSARERAILAAKGELKG